jgi:phosphatidyl-myo-inositol alpha-mannosyltransferase
MAAGAPVVASDIEAFQRVLDEGRAGVHFRNEDPEDLATVLIAVLGDAQRRDELRAAGRVRAAQFDWATVARQVLAVYESVTPGGEKVEADLSGQFWGRLPLRRRSSGETTVDGP